MRISGKIISFDAPELIMALVGDDRARPLIVEENSARTQNVAIGDDAEDTNTSENGSGESDAQLVEMGVVEVEIEDCPHDGGAVGGVDVREEDPGRVAEVQNDSPLQLLENGAGPGLALNVESFECTICVTNVPSDECVVLEQCKHKFCKHCLASLVKHCEESEVRCPFAMTEFACRGQLLDAEIRALVSQEVLEAREVQSLRLAGFDVATGQLWPSLTETTKRDLVPNSTRFECPLCFAAAQPNAGVVLKQCLHTFCRSCLTDVVEASVLEEVPCPCTSSDYQCEGLLLQEEVRALLGPAAYTRHVERALQHASEQRAARQMWRSLEAVGQQDLAPNTDAFDCPICFCGVEACEGVVLKECLHSFCRECLAGLVRHSDAPEVRCPFVSAEYSCESVLTEKEIRALVSADVFERHLSRSLSQAEGNTANSFHCRTVGCAGWCEFEDTVNAFCCPVCSRVNCITCRAIHEDTDCRSYQLKLAEDARHNEEARQTQEYLNSMVARREAIHCPVCQVVLMKKDGCDWVLCSACRNEVCWVTGKRRWGPRGRGDTSGGCQCRVNGRLCHPRCNNCH